MSSRPVRREAWIAAVIFTLGIVRVASAEPARLFEPLPPFRAMYDATTGLAVDNAGLFDGSFAVADAEPRAQVVYRQVVRINARAIAMGTVTVNLEGNERVAHLVASYQREDESGESFFYSIDRSDGEDGLWSTFTTFYDGSPAYAHIVIDGKGYFVAPEDSHHVITRSRKAPIRENLRVTPPMVSAFAAADTLAVANHSRRRAVRTGWSNRIPLVTIVNTGAVNPYGLRDQAKVNARIAHYFDRQNAAFRNSGEPTYVYCQEIAYVSAPDDIPFDGYWVWASNSPEVETVRARNLAAGSVILLGSNVRFEAVLNRPGVPRSPREQVMLAGGYWREDVDTDVLIFEHEVGGHFLGKNHDVKYAPPTAVPNSHDWTSCERMQHGPTAYADCGGAMETVEIYSGERAKKLGYPIDLDLENSVAVSTEIGRELAKDWPQP